MARKMPDPMSEAVNSINKMNSLASEVADLAIEFSNKVVELERGLQETRLPLREAQLRQAFVHCKNLMCTDSIVSTVDKEPSNRDQLACS